MHPKNSASCSPSGKLHGTMPVSDPLRTAPRLDRNMALRIDESADKIPETFRGMALVAKTSSPNPIFFGIIWCLPS